MKYNDFFARRPPHAHPHHRLHPPVPGGRAAKAQRAAHGDTGNRAKRNGKDRLRHPDVLRERQPRPLCSVSAPHRLLPRCFRHRRVPRGASAVQALARDGSVPPRSAAADGADPADCAIPPRGEPRKLGCALRLLKQHKQK